MANISFPGMGDLGEMLCRWQEEVENGEMVRRAVIAGAAPVADAIRAGINNLPTEPDRYLSQCEQYNVLADKDRDALSNHFGIAPVKEDRRRFVHTKVGFEGYSGKKTKKYPKGVPIPLLAAAVESGSSVRAARPFIRSAVRHTRKKALAEMEKQLDGDIQKII